MIRYSILVSIHIHPLLYVCLFAQALAFVALGRKFQSVTHLELLQLALERHYKLVVEMIAAWGGGANQLADVKVFFSKELFTAEGTALK